MTCPYCATELGPVIAGALTVCQLCASSLVLDEDVARPATAEDVLALSAADQMLLRKARPAAWRADVKARKAQIRGSR